MILIMHPFLHRTVSKQKRILDSFFFYAFTSNSSLITSTPEYLLKELSAIAVLFNLHEGRANTQHKRESTTHLLQL